MYKTSLYFLNGEIEKNSFHKNLILNHSNITTKTYKYDNKILELHYDDVNDLNKAIEGLDTKKVAIFYDNSDIRSIKGILKPHIIKNDKIIKNKITDELIPGNGGIPPNFATYYNFPSYGNNPTHSPTKVALLSFGGTYLTSDLTYFWEFIGNTVIPTINYIDVDGATNEPNQTIVSGDGSSENTLDLEIIGSIYTNADITIYFAPNSYTGIFDVFKQVINDGIQLISMSWGGPEVLNDTSQLAINSLLNTAQANGIVISVSAGDQGSGDGLNVLTVDFPGSSPYVICCGGTSLLTSTEVVWNNSFGATGGGQSVNYILPSYQIEAVKNSSQSNVQDSKMRCVPDISMNADPSSGVIIYYQGQFQEYGGTSMVAPLFTAFLGIINQTYPSTGFNTILYDIYSSYPSAFNDITSGNNATLTAYSHNWYAGLNYDCASGIGSIHGQNLSSRIINPTCIFADTLILMENNILKKIEDINRGDIIHNGLKVSRINKEIKRGKIDIFLFKKNCLGNNLPNNDLLITENHPIFFKGKRRPAKCFYGMNDIEFKINYIPKDDYFLYDLQFDEDSSYFANGLEIQSRSPYSDLTPLPLDLYHDKTKYKNIRVWDSYNQKIELDIKTIVKNL